MTLERSSAVRVKVCVLRSDVESHSSRRGAVFVSGELHHVRLPGLYIWSRCRLHKGGDCILLRNHPPQQHMDQWGNSPTPSQDFLVAPSAVSDFHICIWDLYCVLKVGEEWILTSQNNFPNSSSYHKMIVLGSEKLLKASHLFKRFQIIDNADSL